jgi:hypothetical protein
MSALSRSWVVACSRRTEVKVLVLLLSLLVPALAWQQYSFQARGRTYTITTAAISNSGFTFSGHQMYQPSVILPSALTNNQYVMLFSSNTYAGLDINHGITIFKSAIQWVFWVDDSNGGPSQHIGDQSLRYS